MDVLLFFGTAAAAYLSECQPQRRPRLSLLKLWGSTKQIVTTEPNLYETFPALRHQQQRTRDAPLLGVLFAASWCPDCQPVTSLVQQVVELQENLLEVVYVGSERSAEELTAAVPPSLLQLDFADASRNELKKAYGTCAQKEMAQVGLTIDTRRRGIPTLLLFDAASGKLLKDDGVDDVVEHKKDLRHVLAKWKQLGQS